MGLVSTYLCTYGCTEEFLVVLANYVVSQYVRITYRPDMFLLTFSNRGHCYATLIKPDIHLIVFDQPVYRKIQLIAVKLMTSSNSCAHELKEIAKDFN